MLSVNKLQIFSTFEFNYFAIKV